VNPRIVNISNPIIQPKPPELELPCSSCMHESRQQYSEFFVNVAVPLQSVSSSHTLPDSSAQVSSLTSKFSGVVPFGITNMLSGISSSFPVSSWVYDMLIEPWKWPDVSGSTSRVRFCVPLADISSGSDTVKNSMLCVTFMFVRFCSPKLKSSIVSWVLFSVNSSR